MATLYTKIKLYLEANSKTWDDDNIKETKKASAKQKLIDLGLTEEEVKALIGV
jgi:hypothetical protein